ncbi:Uncharacterised protein [Gordonia bronchialis]|nr:Uncharacterised protein [Gordonia bronchialis]
MANHTNARTTTNIGDTLSLNPVFVRPGEASSPSSPSRTA